MHTQQFFLTLISKNMFSVKISECKQKTRKMTSIKLTCMKGLQYFKILLSILHTLHAL